MLRSPISSVAASRSWTAADRDLVEQTLNPHTALLELRRVKAAAKRSLVQADSTEQREAAALIYNLALAAAHAHHGTSISSQSGADQHRCFARLADAFADGPVAELFRIASVRTG